MVCPYCGKECAENDTRCGVCGRRLKPNRKFNPNKTGFFCGYCGYSIEMDYVFCRGCGRRLVKEEANDLPGEETPGLCPYCGNECAENDTRCKVCGTPIERERSASTIDRGEKTEQSENNDYGIGLAKSYFNALAMTSKRIIDEEHRQKIEQKPYLMDVFEFINYLISSEYLEHFDDLSKVLGDLKIYLPRLFPESQYYVFFPEVEDFPETKKYFFHEPNIDVTSLLKEKEKNEAKGFAKEVYRTLWSNLLKYSKEVIPFFISSKGNNINDILILPIAEKTSTIYGIIILTKDEGFEDKYLEIAAELPGLLENTISWAFRKGLL